MFKIKWDEEINGVLLTDKTNDEVINPPRPVFYEELDLLGFNKYWDYPKSREPLLWAIRRRYYYKGIMVAEAKGGNLFQSPSIVITEEGNKLHLKPIAIKKVAEKNKKALFVLENEAMDFVEHTYRVYRNKMDFFAVSFSGGKDSQVVLDIVSRVLHPEDFIVIFSDTTMEIPFTYEAVEKTKKIYHKRYPELKFYTAKPPKNASEFWKAFGPPSTIQKWCSTVIKTAPFVQLINDIHKDKGRNKQPKILVFEGVRGEESNKRSKYLRMRKNIRQLYQINAEVIQSWNLTEVFLYLFFRGLELNKGYRYGLDRVGCSVCPSASNWNECILINIENGAMSHYITLIGEYAKLLGLKDNERTKEYIAEGQWKRRAGGRGVDTKGTMLDFLFNKNQLKAVIKNPRENFLEWLKVAGDILYKKENNEALGELKIGSEIFPFEAVIKEEGEVIKFDNICRDITAENKVKKVLYKATYCIHCGACEGECPTGALKVIPDVKINTKLCAHCSNCLNFVEKGCLVAKSVNVYGGNKMRGDKIATSKYQNFGMRREWLLLFLRNTEGWFENNNLGNRQKESLKTWLKDASLLSEKNTPTRLAKLLSNILNESLVWGIIWTNLYYNVNLIKWYLDSIVWGEVFSSKELVEKVIQADPKSKEKTTQNSISSLFNLFDTSPLGKELKIGIIEKRGRERIVKKLGTDEIHPLAVAYSLYKAAEHIGRRDFTVSELYRKDFEGGPYKLFGMARDKLERILRGLQEDKDQILRVDLAADLDNIYLRGDLTSLDIVKIMGGRMK